MRRRDREELERRRRDDRLAVQNDADLRFQKAIEEGDMTEFALSWRDSTYLGLEYLIGSAFKCAKNHYEREDNNE